MSNPKRVVDEDQLRALADQGLSLRQMVPILGVSRPTVARRLQELGLAAVKQRGRTPEPLPPIPKNVGYEDRRKLEYLVDQLDSGKRSGEDTDLLRKRYREILHSPNPDPAFLAYITK